MAGHFLYRLSESLRPKDPGDGDCLPEADPEERHSTCGVEVHQLEHEDSPLAAHRQPSTEAQHTNQHGELLPVGPEEVGPVVHQAGDEGLHVAELAVDPQDLRYESEGELSGWD